MKQEWYDNLFNELRCSALASEVQYALMSTPLGVNDTITEFFSTHMSDVVLDLVRFSEAFSYGGGALSVAVDATKADLEQTGDDNVNVSAIFFKHLCEYSKVKPGSHEHRYYFCAAQHYIRPAQDKAFDHFFGQRVQHSEAGHPCALVVSSVSLKDEHLNLLSPFVREVGDISIITDVQSSYGYGNTLYGLCMVLMYARTKLSRTVVITESVFESLYQRRHPKAAAQWGDTRNNRDLFAAAVGFEKVDNLSIYKVNPEPYPAING